MAGITFSEGEVKRLILALAGSKDMSVEESSSEEESPKHEADPKDEAEDAAEGESHGEGKPFGKEEESTKDMLARKLKEKGSK